MRTYFNNHWLEEINGFITLDVSGREDLNVALETKQSVLDGSYLKDSRVVAREINVHFLLKVPRYKQEKALDQLKQILRTSDEQALLFSDEDDKYFGAILSSLKIESKWATCCDGVITFDCLDPYKYATTIKTFKARLGVIKINNEGNVPASIDYRIKINGVGNTNDCGYVGLTSDSGETLEYGSMSDVDKAQETGSVWVVNASDPDGFLSKLSTTTQSPLFPKTNINGKDYATPSDYTAGSGWRYSANWLLFSANAGSNFMFQSRLLFETVNNKTVGGIHYYFNDGTSNFMAVRITKSSQDSNWATATVEFPGKSISKTVQFQMIGKYAPFASDAPLPLIEVHKNSDKLTVYIAGTAMSFSVPALASTRMTRMSFAFYKFGELPVPTMGIRDLKLRIDDSSIGLVDIPNRFTKGDILEISGDEARMRKNGVVSNGDEIIGSVYFKARPGVTEVRVNQSSWAIQVAAEAYIRERWL